MLEGGEKDVINTSSSQYFCEDNFKMSHLLARNYNNGLEKLHLTTIIIKDESNFEANKNCHVDLST